MHGAADILHGVTIILRAMARILSDVPDILHVQHTKDLPKIYRRLTEDLPKIYP